MLIKGTMWISNDPLVCYKATVDQPISMVLSLDEDNTYKELNPANNHCVFSGSILLPPTEALWAEIDGDIESFKYIYQSYLQTPQVDKFIFSLIIMLHLNNDIVIYSPEEDQTGLQLGNHSMFLVSYIDAVYGVHIGTDYNNVYSFNEAYVPKISTGLYMRNIITPDEFFFYYPVDLPKDISVYNKLINDINPYGLTLEDKIQELDRMNFNRNIGKRLTNALISV